MANALAAPTLLLAFFAQSPTGVPDISPVDLRCGAYCTYVSLVALSMPVGSYEEFEKHIGQPTNQGYSMRQLASAAEAFGAYTLGVETTLDNLENRPHPFTCIALLESDNHFVCIYDVDDVNVHIIDPPTAYVTDRDAFSRLWSGQALLISTEPLSLEKGRDYLLWSLVLVPACIIIVSLLLTYRLRGSRGELD